MDTNYINYINYDRRNTDFNVVQYGYRKCEPGFGEKPHIWSDFLLHYVYSGKGTLWADGRRIPVETNQAFLIFPGQIANYIADADDPFEYRWVEFYGAGMKYLLPAAGVYAESPIISDTDGKVGNALKNIVDCGDASNARLMAAFWLLVDALSINKVEIMSTAERYVQRAIHYIGSTIGQKITVNDVCRELCISRNYMTNIFTQSTGMSPKRYITKQHMDMAAELLRRTEYSIGEVANMVGYSNPGEFTKAFIRYKGISPSEYRKHPD